MARKETVVRTDDLNGRPNASEVTFSLDGQDYTIDLTDRNAKQLRDKLKEFINAARPSSRLRRAKATKTRKSAATSQTIRAWARENGLDVNDRGRISTNVMTAYTQAHSTATGSRRHGTTKK